MSDTPHILIITSKFYFEVTNQLFEGASDRIKNLGFTSDSIDVPGVLEISTALSMAIDPVKYNGYIVLGCLVGEPSDTVTIANQSARSITDLTINHKIALGNGILVIDTKSEALKASDPNGDENFGSAKVYDLVKMMNVRDKLISPKTKD